MSPEYPQHFRELELPNQKSSPEWTQNARTVAGPPGTVLEKVRATIDKTLSIKKNCFVWLSPSGA